MKFTLSLEKILMQTRKEAEFEWSTPLKKPVDERDIGKFCDHHRDHMHNTEQCRNLCNLLESMVWADSVKLGKNTIFLKNGKTVICRCSTS